MIGAKSNPVEISDSDGKYHLKLSVVAPDGSVPFTGDFVAERSDLYERDMATPGLAPVVAFLTKAVAD